MSLSKRSDSLQRGEESETETTACKEEEEEEEEGKVRVG